jgi:hypothetical protein
MGSKMPAKVIGIYASLCHFLIVGCILLIEFIAKEPTLLIIYIDFPLFWILSMLPGGNFVLNSTAGYIGFPLVVGTLMYGAAGCLVGWIANRISSHS